MADMKKISIFKSLIGMSLLEHKDDDRISFAIDYAEGAVKNYCRLNDIPEELKKVIFMIAKDFFEGGEIGSLKALKEGDVSFYFTADAFSEKELFKKYLPQLENFRKLGW